MWSSYWAGLACLFVRENYLTGVLVQHHKKSNQPIVIER